MLKVTVPKTEGFVEKTNEFVSIPEYTLHLEHSLLSLAKWEAKWKKPFISKEPKTYEETVDYISCMSLDQNINIEYLKYIPDDIVKQISNYIEDSMTATTFREENKKNREIITNEIIYYWMISLNIPFECQKWHLNRLLTLIRVCSIKNAPQKKMSAKELASRNRALNKARLAKYNTRG